MMKAEASLVHFHHDRDYSMCVKVHEIVGHFPLLAIVPPRPRPVQYVLAPRCERKRAGLRDMVVN